MIAPEFSPDGSIVVYGDNTGSANPTRVSRYVAATRRPTSCSGPAEPPTIATGVELTADRAIISVALDDVPPAIVTASITRSTSPRVWS